MSDVMLSPPDIDQLIQLNVITASGKINSNIKLIIASNPDVAVLQLPLDHLKMLITCHLVNIDTIPRCKQCGIVTGFTKSRKPKKSCSRSCNMKYTQRNITDHGKRISRVKKTNQQRYGVDYPLANNQIQLQAQQTVQDRYNVHSAGDIVASHTQRKQTNLAKYGDETSLVNPHIRAKSLKTNQLNYQRNYHQQNHISTQSLLKLDDPVWLAAQHKDKPLTQIAQEQAVGVTTVSRRFARYKLHVRSFYKSSGERDLGLWIQSMINSPIVFNSRRLIPPSEIDIYLPDIGLAIEYNGIYWHSEGNGKSKTYHVDKTNACISQNIRLIQIWDCDWIHQTDNIKHRLMHALHLNTNSIYARDCSVQFLTEQQSSPILSLHTQHATRHSIRIGLVYQDEVVACATFGKSRFSKQHKYELIRFVTKSNTSVVGGLSKLCNYFVSKYGKAIVTYCNRMWGEGGGYKAAGFTQIGSTVPGYHYFKNGQITLMNRMRFQKHKLGAQLEHFDPDQTEWSNMRNHGYDRVWDCGHNIFEYMGAVK